MTFETFLGKLRATPMVWSKWKRFQMIWLRGVLPSTDQVFCPVTAVAYELTGHYYHVSAFKEAAKAIGLRLDTARKIVRAADGLSDPNLAEKLDQIVGVKGRRVA